MDSQAERISMDDAVGSKRQGQSVFLSYASLDRDAARSVATGLRLAGVDVWWDEGGIGWGDDWQGKLEEALNRCGAYLILARGRYDRDGMGPYGPAPRRAAPGGPGPRHWSGRLPTGRSQRPSSSDWRPCAEPTARPPICAICSRSPFRTTPVCC
jgi:hypothetical protein